MTESRAAVSPELVAGHYNELDRFYREVWGEHVHHGLWESRHDSSDRATRRLIELVAREAGIDPGDRVCDVGCGYGGTARVLAAEYGAAVTGLTISAAQHAYAEAADPGASNPSYLLRDWLRNDLSAESFEAVIAIESTEHMADLHAFFSEAVRVLRPGGRLVVCAWLTRDRLNRWERRHLIQAICREGRLCGMGTADGYQRLARANGLESLTHQDLSGRVKRTWPVCVGRVARGVVRDPSYVRFLLKRGDGHKVFALTLLRIWLAYELGAMRYGMLTFQKPRRLTP
jgi:tocopherol O-methyltransferase